MGLGEAQAGIPDDGCGWNPRCQRRLCALHQAMAHLLDHIVVGRELIHGAAVATAVHQHNRTLS